MITFHRVPKQASCRLERTHLIELMPPGLLPDCLAVYGTKGREVLDPYLREVETHLRKILAAGSA